MITIRHIIILLVFTLGSKLSYSQCNLKMTSTTDSALCNSGTSGQIVSSTTGGSGTYQYILGSTTAGGWQTSGTFSSLAAGSYVVSVRDAKNTTCITCCVFGQ